ncbi:MAG TPA: ABC transporter permease [Gemmatimonadaceae bacterium]|nr:ABC transporter permease [Gemmatimonadaceae bacterium]
MTARWREWVAALILATIVLGAVLIPLLAPTNPLRIGDVFALRLLPPLARDSLGHLHLLGTDQFGRDILARMMLAARVSLLVGVLGSGLAGVVGIAIGALSAWLGGAADRTMMSVTDALLSIPRLVLLLVAAALWQPGVTMVVIVLVATGWMGVARLVRAEVLSVRARPFVEAAQALGAPRWRVLWRHVLPNTLGAATVAITLGVGGAILLESGLSFLGLGIRPPQPSWGNMIADGRQAIVVAPWISLAPGIALIATVLASTLLGDVLRDRLAGEVAAPLRDRA